MADKGKKILVIAPDPILMTTRAAILEREGYEVATAESSEKALARLKAESVDLVVLGSKDETIELDRQVRERHPSLPILRIELFPEDSNTKDDPGIRVTDSAPTNVIQVVEELLGA